MKLGGILFLIYLEGYRVEVFEGFGVFGWKRFGCIGICILDVLLDLRFYCGSCRVCVFRGIRCF